MSSVSLGQSEWFGPVFLCLSTLQTVSLHNKSWPVMMDAWDRGSESGLGRGGLLGLFRAGGQHLPFLLGGGAAVEVGVGLGHLQHPARRDDARLFLDGAEQRRERLHDVLDGRDALAERAVAAGLAARVPHGDLGLQALDGFGVGQRQLLVRVLLEHQVGEQALGAAECFGQRRVCQRLGVRGLCLAHACVEHGVGFLGLALHAGLDLPLLFEQLGVGLLGLALDVGLDLPLLLEQLRVGGLFLGVRFGVGRLGVAVVVGFRLALCRLLCDLRPHEIFRSKSFQLRRRLLHLDFFLQFGVASLGRSSSLDLCHLDAHIELRLSVRQFGVGLCFVGFAPRLEHRRLGLNLGDFLLGVAPFASLADLASHPGFGNVDPCLVRSPFMRLSGKECEVFGPRGVLKFLDVGIVDAETELVEFFLHIFNDLEVYQRFPVRCRIRGNLPFA